MKKLLYSTFLSLTSIFMACSSVIEEDIINKSSKRENLSINDNFKFFKYDSIEKADDLIYEARPEIESVRNVKPADSKPTEAIQIHSNNNTLKAWILPTGNAFLKDSKEKHIHPLRESRFQF